MLTEQYGSKKETTTIPVSEEIRWRVTKNKTAGTKGNEGSYVMLMRDNDLHTAGTIVEHEYIFKLAMHHLVEKTKTGYKLGDREWTTQKAILVDLREDEGFMLAVRSTLLKVMMKSNG